jgi:spermidine/putrescine transport system permease protein
VSAPILELPGAVPSAAPAQPTPRIEPVPRPVAIGFAVLVYVFLYAPVIVMAIFSFNSGSVQSLPLKGFTLDWYSRLFSDSAMIDALVYSAKVSLLAVLVAMVAGTAFAMLFTYIRVPGLRLLQGLIALPFVTPGLVLGVSLLLAYKEVGIHAGFLAIVIAHVAFVTPIIMFVVAQRLASLDPSLAQASMDLGAGRLRTFAEVILPSIRTSLIAGALLAFTVSFDEVVVTFFVAGSEQTLPVHIWTLLRFGFSPSVNAILTIITVVSIALVALSTVVLARGERRRSA